MMSGGRGIGIKEYKKREREREWEMESTVVAYFICNELNMSCYYYVKGGGQVSFSLSLSLLCIPSGSLNQLSVDIIDRSHPVTKDCATHISCCRDGDGTDTRTQRRNQSLLLLNLINVCKSRLSN